jgi:hypothetical protein
MTMLLIRHVAVASSNDILSLLPIRWGYLVDLYRGFEMIAMDIAGCQLNRLGINIGRKDTVWLSTSS